MSRVAINAKNPEEIRVATFDDHQVSDLYIENTLKKPSLKDIYAGVVRSIEPSLEAVFVEYGAGRHGFLQFKDVASEYCKGENRQHLKSSLKIGQSIIVQVKKEEREGKGAALTTYITLPGTYLVLMPNHASAGGVSKQIAYESRKDMQQIISQLNPPTKMSVILRTAGAGKTIEELKRDMTLLLKQWEDIKIAFNVRKAPFLIFQEGDILARTIRDYTREDVTEIIVDDASIFEKTKNYATIIRPDLVKILRLYKGKMPLFLHLGIEDEVESAFQHTVRLPSGGSIILDRAAAGVMIDVNSGSATKHGDITETALKTNLEAAEMIARQLRLRDLGGLILIDFIGMREEEHKKQIETKLWESTEGDRARIQIGNILPRFDVLVMSRQRLRSSLGRVNEDACLACEGQGIQRSIESLALSIIRAVERKLFGKKVSQIRIESSVAIATYLSNEKRNTIYALEKEHQFSLLLLPNPHWEITQYKITSFNADEPHKNDQNASLGSYTLISDPVGDKANTVIMPSAELPAVERFSSQTKTFSNIAAFSLLKTVFNKLKTWPRENLWSQKSSTSIATKPNSVKGTGRKNVSQARERKPTGAYNSKIEKNVKKAVKKPVLQQAAHELKQTSSLKQSTKEKLEVPATVNKMVEPVVAAISSTQEIHPTPTPQRTLLKKPAVNRYGGEPRLQKRGY